MKNNKSGSTKKLVSRVIALGLALLLLASLAITAFAVETPAEELVSDQANKDNIQLNDATTPKDPPVNPDANPSPVIPPPPEPMAVSYLAATFNVNVKKNGVDIEKAVKAFLVDELKKTGSTQGIESSVITPESGKFDTDKDLAVKIVYTDKNFQDVTVKTKVVTPKEITFKDAIPEIMASADSNRNNNALLDYVNTKLEIVGSDAEYKAALGNQGVTAAPRFQWTDTKETFNPFGGTTYIFRQTIEGIEVIRTVKVNEVGNSSPSIYVNYKTGKVNTRTDMQYKLDNDTWRGCSENMDVSSSWYGRYVSFKYSATSYRPESASTTVYMPEKEGNVAERIKVSSNSHSVTVENCWDFNNIEFAISTSGNSSSEALVWERTTASTKTFDNLREGTNYVVMARHRATEGKYLAGNSISESIKTSEKAKTLVDVPYRREGSTGYVPGIATMCSTISNKILQSSLSSEDLSRFKAISEGYKEECRKVESYLTIKHYKETNETKEIQGYRMSLPMSSVRVATESGGMYVEYLCDMMNINISNSAMRYLMGKTSYGTLSIDISRVDSIYSGSRYEWIKGELKDGRPVYKLSVKNSNTDDANIEYSIPYKLAKDETIAGLSISYVDTEGNRQNVPFDYDALTGRIKFTTDESGYFVISHSNRVVTPIKFSDVPSNFWAYKFIEYSYNKGIFEGVSEREFNPAGLVTNSQIATILARTDGVDTGKKPTKTNHRDVKVDDWFATGANWAYDMKLMYSGDFLPDNNMKREDIAYMIYNYMTAKKISGNTELKLPYTDIDRVGSEKMKAISYMASKGIMSGKGKNIFDPEGFVTRAEMSTIMYRMAGLIE